ncbi:MAG TPA: Dabb family protein [Gemmatales bacterium]|nr:Dabb family protein [Gemmatales bacterium]HMP16025.1 Dabb family protein [Gemmatales bacterium]
MKQSISRYLVLALILVSAGWYAFSQVEARSHHSGAPMIGHMVFFTLKETSPAARQKLVDACKKYLDKHEGTIYFSAGVLSDAFTREVNDRDWDVALHLVFKDKAAHDKYQDHPRHIDFINENKDSWKKVRVFDSEIK